MAVACCVLRIPACVFIPQRFEILSSLVRDYFVIAVAYLPGYACLSAGREGRKTASAPVDR